mmetsp:Transcript_8422/g.9616  ORF Transcript_8422/g.9616 Transcript_8422/m.9616 type:complete len:243 (-) Transcript_8422:30-758(-)|eukprot:CAMPEP_0184036032 /NCGR_PEP_ID=MMETSP0955-20130417/29684_1 /TAXON_ID=627963 /ORGANISM="Aplanochytrium sp, Strain PBS07" /LENGTH=242 /DNA_ID=CAMNT_0026323461 /DNA_START=93 /DNA_END=821 /DNA_ORIENTATION=+
MAEPVVLRRQEGAVAILTINRPKKLNALSREVFTLLGEHLKSIAKDTKNIGCVLLTGAGRAFSAGNDIKGDTPSDDLAIRVIDQIETLPQPVIALVNGMCYTGAFEVVAACDIVLCCEKNAYFCDTHAKLGIVPTWGGNFRLPRRVGLAQAKKIFFTCKEISPIEAKEIGLVADIAPEGKLLEMGLELANDICKQSRVSVMRQKMMINTAWQHTIKQSIDILSPRKFHPGHEFTFKEAASKL